MSHNILLGVNGNSGKANVMKTGSYDTCSKTVVADPFPCPSCSALRARIVLLEKIVAGSGLTNVCPFCYEDDFDRVGLKHHLLAGQCDAFNETAALEGREGK
jgi:hypothetical protein